MGFCQDLQVDIIDENIAYGCHPLRFRGKLLELQLSMQCF